MSSSFFSLKRYGVLKLRIRDDFRCRFRTRNDLLSTLSVDFCSSSEKRPRVVVEIPPGWYLGGIWVVSHEFPKTLATIEESSIGWYGWYLVPKNPSPISLF